MGVVHDPVCDEVFWTQKGVGAFLDQYKLRLANNRSRNYIAMALPSPRHTPEQCNHKITLFHKFPQALLCSFGSTALHLAYVAAGRLDGSVEYATRVWDSAAEIILIREAGGNISHQFREKLNATDTSDLVAAHPELYNALRGANPVNSF